MTTEASKRLFPPESVTILWCPECGRDDRYIPFTGKSHFIRGGRCPGTPVKVTYGWPVDREN